MSDGAKTGTPITDQARFTITWRNAAYYVSIPNYGGGEVVPYKTALTLEVRLGTALDALSAKQATLTEALKVAGEALDRLARAADREWLSAVPAYTDCLNACHEMEKVLTDEVIVYTHNGREWGTTQRGMYFQMLSFGNDMKGNHVMKSDGIHATSSQRCEAFLRTLNLWTPTGEDNE